MSSPYGSAAGLPPPPEVTPGAGRPINQRMPRQRRRVWPGVLFAIAIGVAVIITVARRSGDGSGDQLDRLAVGDCFLAPDTALFTPADIDVVDCAEDHNHEVYAIGTSTEPIGATPDAAEDPEIVRICRTEVPAHILDVLAGTPDVTPGVIASKGSAGRVVCSASTPTRHGSLLEGITSS